MKLWITQFWNGIEWRNSIHKNVRGRDMLIIHENEQLAQEALEEAKCKCPEMLLKSRVVPLELPNDALEEDERIGNTYGDQMWRI